MKSAILAVSLFGAASHGLAVTDNFDAYPSGKPPPGWSCGATGRGTPNWTIVADASAASRPNVLKQSGIADFPWCVKGDTSVSDGAVEVRFKSVSGKEDQAGGLVWRWKDGNNYYVARANALENNVSLYYTKDGSRKTIMYKDAPVTPAAWHLLRVEFKGNSILVLLDGKPYIQVDDSHIPGPGKVGVWTKADSVTLFDDFSYTAAAK